jgi:hypothetical protein
MREILANYNYYYCPSLLCPYGHMDMWTYGHLDTWTYRRMEMWTYGHNRDREEKFRSLVQKTYPNMGLSKPTWSVSDI